MKTGDLAIVNATVIDGTGAEPRGGATVIVRHGLVDRVGAATPPTGIPVVEGEDTP